MTGRASERIVIQSEDEIPSSFESEDEEREWWATHEFSDDMLERYAPSWDDVAEMLLAPRYSARAPQVEFPLSVARRHLRYVKRARPGYPLVHDIGYEHTSQVVVFAASAVEAALNLWLTAPRLRLSSQGRMVGEPPNEVTWPARKKLSFVAKRAEELQGCGDLVGRVDTLLVRRDNLVHALPPGGGPDEEDIVRVRDYYEAAEEFLGRLLLPAIDNRVVDDS
jgi:hypothetical protein